MLFESEVVVGVLRGNDRGKLGEKQYITLSLLTIAFFLFCPYGVTLRRGKNTGMSSLKIFSFRWPQGHHLTKNLLLKTCILVLTSNFVLLSLCSLLVPWIQWGK